MKVQIASIPHNGTQFLLKMLQDNNIEVDCIGHLTDNLDYSDWTNIIVPMRKPYDVAISWGRRRKDYGWDEMYQRLLETPAHFFFLEDRSLDKLSIHLGMELITDWKPVNHSEEESITVVTEGQILGAEAIYSHLYELSR